MEFRQATPADIDRIMEILVDGRRSIGSLGIDQWQGGYPTRDVVENDVEKGYSYVVTDEENPIATAAVLFDGEEIYDVIDGEGWLTDSLSHEPRYCTIHRVAVGSDALGKGAAKFLLASIEELARCEGSESVRIDTHEGNGPMRGLVSSCGFTECGIVLIKHAEEATPERIAYEKVLKN